MELFEMDEIFADAKELFDLSLPSPDLLEYYRRLWNREILWNADIDCTTIDIPMYILKWNKEDRGKPTEDRKPIKIFINTDGGELNTIMHVIDVIELSKTPVVTIALGKALSAGGYLLMAGHKRYVFKNTRCLIHDGIGGFYGDIGKHVDTMEFTKRQESVIRQFVLDKTNITEEEYDSNYRRDWWLFSDEIVEKGIADEIIEDIDVIL